MAFPFRRAAAKAPPQPQETPLPALVEIAFPAPEDYRGTQSTVFFTQQEKRGAGQSVTLSFRDRSVVGSDELCREIGLGQMEQCVRPKSELAEFIVQWTHGNACVETDVCMRSRILYRLSKEGVPFEHTMRYFRYCTINAADPHRPVVVTRENAQRIVELFRRLKPHDRLVTVLRARLSVDPRRAQWFREFLVNNVYPQLGASMRRDFGRNFNLQFADFAEKFVQGALTESDLTIFGLCGDTDPPVAVLDRMLDRKLEFLLTTGTEMSACDGRFLQMLNLPLSEPDAATPTLFLLDAVGRLAAGGTPLAPQYQTALAKCTLAVDDEVRRYLSSNYASLPATLRSAALDASFYDHPAIAAAVCGFSRRILQTRLVVGDPISAEVVDRVYGDFVVCFTCRVNTSSPPHTYVGLSYTSARSFIGDNAAHTFVQLWDADTVAPVYSVYDGNAALSVVNKNTLSGSEKYAGFDLQLWRDPNDPRHAQNLGKNPAFRVVVKNNAPSKIQLRLNECFGEEDTVVPCPFPEFYDLHLVEHACVAFQLHPFSTTDQVN